jgi:hypothetical protein
MTSTELYKQAAKIKSRANRWAVEGLIGSGETNASDTFAEQGREGHEYFGADWNALALGSIGNLLACGEGGKVVADWFWNRGVRF